MRTVSRQGVSLTELAIIVLVVAVALVPIFGLLSSNTRQVSFNIDRATAQIMASQVIERYRYEEYEIMQNKFMTPEMGQQTIEEDLLLSELLLEIPEEFEGLYRKFKREAVFVEEAPGLLGSFTVTVRWTNNQRQERELTSATMIRNTKYHYGKGY